ncbi:MAG TPA: branched-chain amino acid ABC transporter permease [Nocardioidaceae bacterium]|jgi:branched-chain amino acid transport system permease protein
MRIALPSQRGTTQWLLLLVFTVLLLTVPSWAGDYWTRIFTGVAMWSALAMSWNIIGGYAGYISFGQSAFFGIGAYTTALLMQQGRDWNFFATLPVGALIAAVVAVIVGWPVLRLRGAYFAIATWAMAEAFLQLATAAGFTGGSFGLSTPINSSTSFFYYVMLVGAMATFGVSYWLLERSRFGYRVKAVRDHEVAAESVGIDTTRVKIQAFALSALIPGVFGGIYAYWITFINPPSVLAGDITDQMVVMALVGGLGRIAGPALGATLLFLVNRQFLAWFGDTTAYIAVVGALVALVVLFLPDGLVSLFSHGPRMALVRQLVARAVPDAATRWVPRGKDSGSKDKERL